MPFWINLIIAILVGVGIAGLSLLTWGEHFYYRGHEPEKCKNHEDEMGTVLIIDNEETGETHWLCYYCYDRLRRSQETLPIFIISERREYVLYRKAYPELLTDAVVVMANDVKHLEGRRFKRAYVAESVDKNSEVMDYVHRGLAIMIDADLFPIYLWQDPKNYYDWYTS